MWRFLQASDHYVSLGAGAPSIKAYSKALGLEDGFQNLPANGVEGRDPLLGRHRFG
jgi:hypothetical protein